MKIRRKSNQCYNCGASLDSVYNYCPKCGQENNDNNVSLKSLLGDFFNTYLAIDSRFGRTLKPFFIRPGLLTLKYTEGKRVTFAHPLRLYLIISIFYFFTVTIATEYISEDEGDVVQTSTTNVTLSGIAEIDQNTKELILDELSDYETRQLSKKIQGGNLDSLKKFLVQLDSSDQQDIREAVGDSIANELGLFRDSTALIKTSTYVEDDNDSGFDVEIGGEDDHILELIDFEKINQLDKDYPEISNRAVYDSLNMGELGYFDDLVVRQSIRINRSDNTQVMVYVVQNLPLMMLLLIPIFALILKLLYIRRDQLYIKHLIHALHLHSYAYLIFGSIILFTIYLIENENVQSYLSIGAFAMVTIYSFISFLKVFSQHWFKTLVKFSLTGFVYTTAIFVFFLIEMILSLLLY